MAKKSPPKKKAFPVWIAGLVVIAIIIVVVILTGGSKVTRLSPDQYTNEVSLLTHVLVDVRTPEEFAEGHISGAINIPLDDLPERVGELDPADNIVVYCRSGNRSNQAAQFLLSENYESIYDLGGIIDWQSAGYPLTTD